MNRTLILLGLLTVASCTTSTAYAADKPDLRTYPPRDTYERQLQDYQRHGYDSQRNGSLSQESNIQRENREQRSSYEQHRQDNTWGPSRDNSAGQYGAFPGEGGGQSQCGLYGC